MALLIRALAVGFLLCGVGCIGSTPQEEESAVQGDYDDGDPEHRPGQPCLLCHGPGHLIRPPGETSFEIAGTIYGGIDDLEDAGLEDVVVTITDATGFEFESRTNRVGNFMVSLNEGSSEVRQRDRGRTDIPVAVVYPVTVKIARGTDEQEMKTKIWRNGSCAHCHGPQPGSDSVGRVYLFEDTP